MLKFNNRVLNYNTRWLDEGSHPGPSVPSYTLRLKFNDNVTPTFNKGTAVQVSQNPNVWDLTYSNTDWSSLLENQTDLLEVIEANTYGVVNMYNLFGGCGYLTKVCYMNTSTVTTLEDLFAGCYRLSEVPMLNTENVTSMKGMFSYCVALNTVPLYNTSKVTNMEAMFQSCSVKSVPLFDTSNVTTMNGMFAMAAIQSLPAYDTSKVVDAEAMCYMCNSLTSIPLLNTSSMTTVDGMFYGCTNVESGALTLYNQMSAQSIQSHLNTFYNCGSNTVTGAAELAQIPSDWK